MDSDILTNYRNLPNLQLPFLSKLIGSVVAFHLSKYLFNNNFDQPQVTAHKCGSNSGKFI